MKYRRNSDARIREAERAFAASQSIADAEALFAHRMRTGSLSPSDIELLAVLGFQPAHEAYAGLGRAGKPKWTAKALWQEQGQYRGFRLALAALTYNLHNLFTDKTILTEAVAALQLLDRTTVDNYAELRGKAAKQIFGKIDVRLSKLEESLTKRGVERGWAGRWDAQELPDSARKTSEVMIMQYMTLGFLKEIRNMLSPTKGNTFYKIGNSIVTNAIKLASRKEGLSEKAAMAQLYDEIILPEALRLVLLTPTTAPSALSRNEDYYLNEIKAGRFTNASIMPSDACPIPKLVAELWPGNQYVGFTVWTSSKGEAAERIEKALYGLYGFIPHYHFYTKGYKSQATSDIKKGLHEDVLFPEGLPFVPADTVNLRERSQFLGPHERQELRRNETYICENIARLRPDLYS